MVPAPILRLNIESSGTTSGALTGSKAFRLRVSLREGRRFLIDVRDAVVGFHHVIWLRCGYSAHEVTPAREECLGGNSGNLSAGEAEHFYDADAPCKRFRDLLHEVEWLGAGEPDSFGLVRRVDDFLDIGEKLRRFLDFVDEDRRTVALEEERRVFLRCLQDGGVVGGRTGAFDAPDASSSMRCLSIVVLPT